MSKLRPLTGWVDVFLLIALACLWGITEIALGGEKEKLSAISKDDYPKVYLDAGDLPGWKKGQDRKFMGADKGDKAYGKLGGLHSGLVAWTVPKGKFQRIVDIRWVFPTAEAARAYLQDQLPFMGEKMPAIKNAPKIGAETHVFGGPQDIFGMKSRSYIIVFRQGNVVVKFFQYESGEDSELSPLAMSPTCLKIINRIKAIAK